jgi:hypothetical protein
MLVGVGVLIAGAASARAVFGQEAPPHDVLFAGDPAPTRDVAITSDIVSVAPGLPGQPAELAARQTQFLQTLAGKLGVDSNRLQSALDETTRELGGPVPLLLGTPPSDASTFTISLDSEQDAIAKALNISTDQLKSEWVNSSLEDLARAHHVDPAALADAIKASRRAQIDRATAEQKVPAQLADHLKADLDQSVAMLMKVKRGTGDFGYRIMISTADQPRP